MIAVKENLELFANYSRTKIKTFFLLLMLSFLLFFFTRIGEHQATGNKSPQGQGQHKFVAIQFTDNHCDRHAFSVFSQKTGILF